MLTYFYDKILLKYPKIVLAIVFILVSLLGYQALKLEIDASAETLLLENDKDLKYSRLVSSRYKTPDYLVVTYAPKKYLLSDEVLNDIKKLSDELTALPRVKSITSILNVPLLESPVKPIKELMENIPTLESPDTDRDLAKKEFLNSPIYENNLVSSDFKTTALLVNLKNDEKYINLQNKRNKLRQKKREKKLTKQEKKELDIVSKEFKEYRDLARVVEHENIKSVRAIMKNHKKEADLFLGGVSMISDDMVSFVKKDLKTFGTTVLLLLIFVLWIIFRQLRWVVIPITICAASVIATCGILGMIGWEVTVISSNFISLQLIITMSIILHLVVQYRELCQTEPNASQYKLVLDTVLFKAKPSFYAIITTIAGFGSLILCDILPVINLGWMMSAGIAMSLFLTFLIFPAVMVQLKKIPQQTLFEAHFPLIKIVAKLTERYGKSILVISFALFIFNITGVSRLMVENSFIDYFKKTTEIYQGMKVIDQKLGGTTPLDVTLDFEKEETKKTKNENPAKNSDEGMPEDDFEADFEADFEKEFEESKNEAQYWFTPEKMSKIEKVHNYLDSLPEVGKVQSLGTMLKIGRTLNEGKDLDNFKLALIYNELPEKFRKIILDPYVSIENNQVRFSLRVIDSQKDLRRNELLKKIKKDLDRNNAIKDEKTNLSGLLVLYNNMLQGLFNSQIVTLGALLAVIYLMFLVLFRSLKVATIAIISNIIPVGVVFGLMGWANIPLDMMTITIAAISVGIAVDDTIHYTHRYKHEFHIDHDYVGAMHRSHESIGYAMYYTSLTIMIGFSILVLSEFIPTIYFGLLTVMAMLMALASNLLLLPRLMILMKPYKIKKYDKKCKQQIQKQITKKAANI